MLCRHTTAVNRKRIGQISTKDTSRRRPDCVGRGLADQLRACWRRTWAGRVRGSAPAHLREDFSDDRGIVQRHDQPQPAPTVRAREDVYGNRPVHQSRPGPPARRVFLPHAVRTCGGRCRGGRGIGRDPAVGYHSRTPPGARGQQALANEQGGFRPRGSSARAAPKSPPHGLRRADISVGLGGRGALAARHRQDARTLPRNSSTS